jgi:glyoxylase-like metal-dependent hydrolase (beta-lactamase superfamily II)
MNGAEIIPGVWRFEAVHPEWSPDDGGEDGWEPSVGWYAVATAAGVIFVDPLVDDASSLDPIVAHGDGCAGVVRTCHWHQRSVPEVAARFGVEVYAKRHPDGRAPYPADRMLIDGDRIPGGLRVYDVLRADELALLLPSQRALIFGDAMLRRADGSLRMCPETWTQPDGGPQALRRRLSHLAELPVAHVLVMHGPGVPGTGSDEIRRAVA